MIYDKINYMNKHTIQPANRSSLSEQVAKHILKKISSGDMKPGDRVVEARISEELNVSSIPVREAIRELVAYCVLEYVMHKGAQVREVSMRETIDALEVKAALEPLAAALAEPRLAGIIPKLSKCIPKMRQALQQHDHVTFQARNQDFHRLIIEAADNAILLRLWEHLAFDIRTKPIMDYLALADPEQMIDEHQSVIDAIEEGDIEKVAAMLKVHSINLASHLKEKIEKSAEEVKGSSPVIKKRRKQE